MFTSTLTWLAPGSLTALPVSVPKKDDTWTGKIVYIPHTSDWWNHRGVLYYEQKQYEKAIADYTKALVMWNLNSLALRNRATTHTKLKNMPSSRRSTPRS